MEEQFDFSFVTEEDEITSQHLDLLDQMRLFHKAITNGNGLSELGKGMSGLGLISFLNHIVYTSRVIYSERECEN